MEIGRAKQVEELFQQAIDLPPDQRGRFLDERCGSDEALRREVELLLRYGREAPESFLERPPGSAPADAPGTTIGRYKIIELIGEGAFGDVYLAEQTTPVRRRVALKVVKLGMDTKQVVARFEAERQALAMMDHPNIAKIFDAGATESGRPYFAMEFVPGLSLSAYCDDHRLDTDQRLHLFLQICDAIQHAHQKGIIHRDIKPSNLMVERIGDHHVPKVIDFGIAKAMGLSLTERTLYTEKGQLIGTPEYMSPEQAEMSGLNVDTRTDIYSLGVVLYELLAGASPFDPKTFRVGALQDIQRRIREDQPPTPSMRISRLGPAAQDCAARRRLDPPSLRRRLKGDLDWITMKALEKDRDRRYETVNGLAVDIRRHLDHEPVLARAPSGVYRLRKFVRRNRASVVAGTVVAAGLLAAAAVSTGFALSEARHRRVAITERDIAEAVSDFLHRDVLAAAAPSAEKGKGKDVLMREVLDEAAKRIDEASAAGGRFDGKPLVEASIRLTLGETYKGLGEYPRAEPFLERARELRRRELGEGHVDTLASMNTLALLYWNQGRYDEAMLLFLETLEIGRRVLGEEHKHTLTTMSNLAILYSRQGRYEEAERLYMETLEIQNRVLGEEHPDTLKAMNNFALLYARQGRYDKAEPLYRETVEIRQRVLGEEHPDTLSTMGNLALLYWHLGRYDQAEELGVKTLEIHKRILGEKHPDTLKSMINLAILYADQGRYDKAEQLCLETLQICKEVLGVEHPDTLTCTNSLASVYSAQDRDDEAEPLYRETLEIRKRLLGPEHPETLFSMISLAELHYKQGHFEQARSLQHQAIAVSRRVWPEGSWFTGAFLGEYGPTLIKLDRYQEAEVALMEAHEMLTATRGADFERTISVTESLAELYDEWGKPEKAAEYRAKLPAEQDAVASDLSADKQDE